MPARLITVAETSYFQSRSKGILTEEELMSLKDILAAKPTIGDILQGTGGVRKMRFALRNKGKSGGSRVIYFYYDPDTHL